MEGLLLSLAGISTLGKRAGLSRRRVSPAPLNVFSLTATSDSIGKEGLRSCSCAVGSNQKEVKAKRAASTAEPASPLVAWTCGGLEHGVPRASSDPARVEPSAVGKPCWVYAEVKHFQPKGASRKRQCSEDACGCRLQTPLRSTRSPGASRPDSTHTYPLRSL